MKYQIIFLLLVAPVLMHGIDWFEKGLSHTDKGEFIEAVASYTVVLASNPRDTRALLNRGWAWYLYGDMEKAIRDYNQVIALEPSWSLPYNNRGVALSDLGFQEKSLKDSRKALQLEPNSIMAHNNAGVACKILGRYDEAVAWFSRAITLEPGWERLYNNRASVYAIQRRYDDAIADFDKALEILPTYSEALMGRSALHAVKGNFVQSLQDSVKSANGNPADPYPMFLQLFATCSQQRGRTKEVVDRIRTGLPGYNGDEWGYSVAEYVIGDISRKTLILRAGDNQGRLCEAFFAIGSFFKCRGRKYAARRWYKKCVGTERTEFVEYMLAESVLKR
jgi:tetratricopeptide (TPR) repeat protein